MRTIYLRILILTILTAALAAPVRAQEPEPHRAGIVVLHGDESVVSACVSFSEESISGAELLRRSGMQVGLGAYGGLGYGVCAIGDEGCAAGQDCFCQCRSNPCAYWVYSHRNPDDSWAISGSGASGWQVRDGDVDGWVWGDGSTAPPTVTFEQVCPPDTAADPPATPTSAPQSPSPSPTITSAPLPAPILPTPTPAIQTEANARGGLAGYAVFGIVALGLAGWLTLAGVRGRYA